MSSPDLIPSQFMSGVDKAASAIPSLSRILLAAHVNLDGDALGSLVAMGNILKAFGKEFYIYSCTGIPDYLNFIKLPCPVYEDFENLPFRPEGAIYLDCGEPARLGRELASHYADWPSVNIDHHLGDGGMGSLANCIYPEAAATAQLVAYIGLALKQPLVGDMAEAITLGLVTDTGGFCHGNTTASVFELCAILMRNGCDISSLREKLYNNWTEGKLRLWGELFSKVKLLAHKEIALCAVSREELNRHHCRQEDLEGLVENFRRIKSVRISALIREEKDSMCKFSLRSTGSLDVQVMAMRLGGGGHKNAAGGIIELPFHDAVETLSRILEEGLEHYNNSASFRP